MLTNSAMQNSMKLRQAAAQILLSRKAARTNLRQFTEATTPRWVPGKIHRVICEQLDRVVSREIDRLMLLCPPQHGKSKITSERFPAYHLAAELLSQLRRCTRREHIDLWVAPEEIGREALRGDLGLAVQRRSWLRSSAARCATASPPMNTRRCFPIRRLRLTHRRKASGIPRRAAVTTPLASAAHSWGAGVNSGSSMIRLRPGMMRRASSSATKFGTGTRARSITVFVPALRSS